MPPIFSFLFFLFSALIRTPAASVIAAVNMGQVGSCCGTRSGKLGTPSPPSQCISALGNTVVTFGGWASLRARANEVYLRCVPALCPCAVPALCPRPRHSHDESLASYAWVRSQRADKRKALQSAAAHGSRQPGTVGSEVCCLSAFADPARWPFDGTVPCTATKCSIWTRRHGSD
jgi:hypothetical protein